MVFQQFDVTMHTSEILPRNGAATVFAILVRTALIPLIEIFS
jgi:hypothetical protein